MRKRKKNKGFGKKVLSVGLIIWFGGAILWTVLMQIPVFKKFTNWVVQSGLGYKIITFLSQFFSYTGIPKLLGLLKQIVPLFENWIHSLVKALHFLSFLKGRVGVILLILVVVFLFRKKLWKFLKKAVIHLNPLTQVIVDTPKIAGRMNWDMQVGITNRVTAGNRIFVRCISNDGLEELLYDLSRGDITTRDGLTLVSDHERSVTIFSSEKKVITINKGDTWSKIAGTNWNMKIV